jgi:hypothetical protein
MTNTLPTLIHPNAIVAFRGSFPTVYRLIVAALETGSGLDPWEVRELETFLAEAVPAVNGGTDPDDDPLVQALAAAVDACDTLASALDGDRGDGLWPATGNAATDKRRIGQLDAALKALRGANAYGY